MRKSEGTGGDKLESICFNTLKVTLCGCCRLNHPNPPATWANRPFHGGLHCAMSETAKGCFDCLGFCTIEQIAQSVLHITPAREETDERESEEAEKGTSFPGYTVLMKSMARVDRKRVEPWQTRERPRGSRAFED